MKNKELHKIKHLLNRASFGMNPNELLAIKNKSYDEVVDELFQYTYIPILLEREGAAEVKRRLNSGLKLEREEKKIRKFLLFDLQNIWMTNMTTSLNSSSQSSFLERMSLFWHGHFACKTRDFRAASNYLEVIRKNALGDFRTLLLGIAQNGAMIKYLNNKQNVKNRPNENFARELLELFSMGIGNYTEKDIKEAARAFTGWSANKNGAFILRKNRHDTGEKVFFNKRGNFSGEDIIDMLLERKQTAKFISTKVYQYFVNENVNPKHIDELADAFYGSNYDISFLMKKLFKSDWFYIKENIGTKVKSPIDLIVGLRKFFNLSFDQITNVVYVQRILGQELFSPPNVAGWNRDLKWINHTSLLYRLKLGHILVNKEYFDLAVKTEQEGFNFDKKVLRRFKNTKVNFQQVQRAINKFPLKDIDIMLTFLLLPTNNGFELTTSESKASLSSQILMKKILEITAFPEYQFC